MRYAVMSNVHANPTALAKAIDDASVNDGDVFVSLGDIVGYGHSPDEPIAFAREVLVMGSQISRLAEREEL